MKMPALPSTGRLNAAHQEVLTLHAEVSQIQTGFAQEERAHRATVQARRALALALSDEIDAHLHTIRALLAAEAAIERVRAALDGADRYDDMNIIRGALDEQPTTTEA